MGNKQLFERTFIFLKKRRIALFSVILGCLFLAIFFISNQKFSQKTQDFLPQTAFSKQISSYTNADKILNNIVITFTQQEGSEDSLIACVETFVQLLNQDTSLIANLRYKEEIYDVDLMIKNIIYETPFHFDSLHQPLWSREKIQVAIQNQFDQLKNPLGFVNRTKIQNDPLGFSDHQFQELAKIKGSMGMDVVDGYFFSKDHQAALVFIESKNPIGEIEKNTELKTHLEEVTQRVEQKYQAVKVTTYGGILVALENAEQIKSDIRLSMPLALILIIVLIFWGLKGHFLNFLYVFLPSILGGIFGLFITSIFFKELSVITISFGTIFLGISIDYAIHWLFHVDENRIKTIKEISKPLLSAVFTTTGSFFLLYLIPVTGIQQLGLFLGFSLIIAALVCLIILPQLPHQGLTFKRTSINFSSKWINAFAILLFIGSLILTFSSPPVRFMDSLESLNYLSADLKEREKRVGEVSNYPEKKTFFVVSGQSFNDAIKKSAKLYQELQAAPFELSIFSPNQWLSAESAQKNSLHNWKKYWTKQKVDSLFTHLDEAANQVGFSSKTFIPFKTWFQSSLSSEFTLEINPSPINKAFDNLIVYTSDSCFITTIVNVKQEDRTTFYNSFANQKDFFIYDKQAFVHELVSLIQTSLDKLTYISGAIVFVIFFITFRNVKQTIITLLIIFLSCFTSLGIIAQLGIQLNIFNLIVISFIFGLGIDYSIFISHTQNNSTSLTINKQAITFSTVTTLIGIGVLLSAKHPVLTSIAQTSIIGICTVFLLSIVLLPFLLNINYRNVLHSMSVYGTLFWGGSFISLITFILCVIPMNATFRRKLINRLIRLGSIIICKSAFDLDIRWNNPKIQTRTPSIFICNHQSIVDIPIFLSKKENTVLIGNQDVFNNYIYGYLIRKAGYINSNWSTEKIHQKVKERLDEGFSILIFPEGRRTPDGEIHRFKKGAFLMAQELNCPLVPHVISGGYQGLSRHKFLFNQSRVRIEGLEPITVTDYRNQSKEIRDKMCKRLILMNGE